MTPSDATLEKLMRDLEIAGRNVSTPDVLAARSALVSLYNRQREASDRTIRTIVETAGSEVKALQTMIDALQTAHDADKRSLSSQLERLTAENAEYKRLGLDEVAAEFANLRSTVERLKASQLTPEEAANVLRLIPRGWLKEECAKLRLRSLSDQKNEV